MQASVFKNQILWEGRSYSVRAFRTYIKSKLGQAKDWKQEIYGFAEEWLDEEKDEFLVPTSGSTGKAKKIMIHRSQMIQSAISTGDYLKLKPGNKALFALPAQFIAGKMMMVRAFVLGLDLYCFPPKVSVLLEVKHPFEFAALIPLQIQFGLDAQLISKIELLGQIIIGGAPLAESYTEQLIGIKSQCYATYGMTETITHIAMKKLNGKNVSPYIECLPGISVEVDEKDCLQIFSDRLPQKITTTNDRVRIMSNVQFEVLGRADFVINSGGLKIQPEEIEEKLRSLLDQSFMIGYKSDSILGQKLVLMIEADEEQVDLKELQLKMDEVLPKNKIPKEMVFVDTLFKTENYKIDRLKNLELLSK